MERAAGVIAGVSARAGDAAVEDERAVRVVEQRRSRRDGSKTLRLAAVFVADDGGVRSDSAAFHSAVFSQPSGIEDGFRNTTYVFGQLLRARERFGQFAKARGGAGALRMGEEDQRRPIGRGDEARVAGPLRAGVAATPGPFS